MSFRMCQVMHGPRPIRPGRAVLLGAQSPRALMQTCFKSLPLGLLQWRLMVSHSV